jgi:glycerol-3-phosphate acyltransferase PlsX
MKDQLNRDRYGGAPLLGLRGYILKAHGASNKFAIMNAIRVAQEVVRCNLNERAQKDIMKVNRILRATEIESLTVS